MKRDEIKAHRAAKIVAAAKLLPTPINPGFISITELLARLQTAPADPPTTLTDAAEWLLFNWCNAETPPVWKCNGKLGIVSIDAFAENHEIPLKRLDYVFHRGQFESDGPDSGASVDYEFFGFDRKEFAEFMALMGEPVDLFCPAPEAQADTAPAQSPATTAPKLSNEASPDRTLLATREQLISAFGAFTGMDATWFKNTTDTPSLHAARKVTGQGGRGHIAEPLFCPFEVLQWLIDPARRKGRPLGKEKGWELLERHFPIAHAAVSVGDPRKD